MKFVASYLTKHHLLHTPNRWFLALLVSPVHALEVHYQKKYHLQFKHARKLFLFDIFLLTSIAVIGSAGVFWFYYDPTVQKDVILTLTIDTHNEDLGRVNSGQHLFFNTTYKNNSAVELINPTFYLNLPPGFILFSVSGGNFVSSSRSISLPSLLPKNNGTITIEGQFLGTPDTDYPTGVELVYHQKNHSNFEVVTAKTITTLRGSKLVGSIISPNTILENSTWNSQLVLKNNYHHNLDDISVPLNSNGSTSYKIHTVTTGKIEKDNWRISQLSPGESVTSSLTVTARVPQEINTVEWGITPSLLVGGRAFSQQKIISESSVARPSLLISSTFKKTTLEPGETGSGIILIKNSGTVDLKNVTLKIPLPGAIISLNSAKQKNPFTITGTNLIITPKNFPALAQISVGTTIEIPLTIPIVQFPSGSSDLQLILNPKISANITGTDEIFTTDTKLSPLSIGTSIKINSDAHYYSLEGDQIGRGPLPPQVGKETKYWALLEVQNGTSPISDVTLTAQLPAYTVWTGKTSVSTGRQPIYSTANRTVTWKISSLSAFETANVNFELSLTPTESQKNTAPLLLTNISVAGFDNFIEKNINGFGANLDASLPSDLIARKNGTLVQ